VRTVRIPKNLIKAILHRARTEKVDESTAMRQLLALGTDGDVIMGLELLNVERFM